MVRLEIKKGVGTMINNKKGITMEQLILIFLALLLLFFLLGWAGGMGDSVSALLHKLLEFF